MVTLATVPSIGKYCLFVELLGVETGAQRHGKNTINFDRTKYFATCAWDNVLYKLCFKRYSEQNFKKELAHLFSFFFAPSFFPSDDVICVIALLCSSLPTTCCHGNV